MNNNNNNFINEDFLLENEFSKKIYKEIKDLPIIDYHCHLDAKEIYENKVYSSLSEIWLGSDHYKWRAMRIMGVCEDLITGKESSDYQKFVAWATITPYLAGNPLYHFSHMELSKYFGITTPLNKNTAEDIYKKGGEMLAKMGARDIINSSGVEVIISTNDPLEDLEYHKLLSADKTFDVKVLPAFRPDKAINIEKPVFNIYIKELSALTGTLVSNMDDIKTALTKRLDYFEKQGAIASDHGVERLYFIDDATLAEKALQKALDNQPLTLQEEGAYKTHLLIFLAKEYKKRNMVMELHFGCARDNSSTMLSRLGHDSGFDTIHSETGAGNLSYLLDAMEKGEGLPKMLLFSLNPMDNPVIATVMGSFQQGGTKGWVQQGAAWWFNDSKLGMETHLENYASLAPLDSFVGMLTDSRSLLSYARHDYFRRILANYLGKLVKTNQYPISEWEYIIETAKNISYQNAKNYFNL